MTDQERKQHHVSGVNVIEHEIDRWSTLKQWDVVSPLSVALGAAKAALQAERQRMEKAG